MAVAVAEAIPQDGGGRDDLPRAGDVEELILSCNKDGMEHLRRGEHKEAFEQFKYAEAVLLGSAGSDSSALLAVTCGNLGCYYKKVGKFHGALSYLRRALKMEVELKTDEVTLAGTHLNLCAVLSKLEKHDKAVQHSLCALELMSKHVSGVDTEVSQDDYAVLAIAYHNVAMEREFLEQWDQAATASIDGFQVAKRLLGENHPLSITLGANCEAVLKKQKARKASVPHMHGLARDRGGSANPGDEEGDENAPQPGGLKARTVTEKIRLPTLVEKEVKAAGTREEAADWVKSEENLWTQFAQKALGTGPGPQAAAAEDALAVAPEAEGALKVPQLLAQNLRAMRDQPSADEPSMLRPIKVYDMGNLGIESLLKRSQAKHTPLAQVMEDKPEALMDIMDAELHSQVSMRTAPNEIRPNRSMKRLTRTTRVLRKTGNFSTTDNRDRVQAEIEKRRADRKALWKDPVLQRFAAEKIQRVWRSWYAYCQENAEWMTITWICATMIQSHWRSYHVRRVRRDKAASDVQRHIRGFLVRNVLKRHTAAVSIQRRVVGIQTRAKIAKLHEHATTIQRLVRGGLARHYCTDLRAFKTDVAVIIQTHVRAHQARCRVATKRTENQKADTKLKATTDLQRMFRGWKGRQYYQGKNEERMLHRARNASATVIQASVRRVQAKKRVDHVRADRDEEMAKAVTFVRKMWLGRQARRRIQEMRETYEANPEDVITLQRYLRGCIVRVRLWREAVQTEELLWAAIEIQRAWRGYAGRLAWELLYERMWRRELAAATIQRNTRMGLARLRVRRMQRALARAEFEKARSRFRAAVKLQALARGVMLRRRHRQRVVRESRAAVAIQRIHRGRSTRLKIWNLVVEQKATLIAAHIRGWLIRRRMANFTKKVVYLQRKFRQHRKLSSEVRDQRVQQSRHRREQASKIARFYRQFADTKRARNVRAPASEASTAETE